MEAVRRAAVRALPLWRYRFSDGSRLYLSSDRHACYRCKVVKPTGTMAALRTLERLHTPTPTTGVSYTALLAVDTQIYRRFMHGATGARYTESSRFTGVSYTAKLPKRLR